MALAKTKHSPIQRCEKTSTFRLQGAHPLRQQVAADALDLLQGHDFRARGREAQGRGLAGRRGDAALDDDLPPMPRQRPLPRPLLLRHPGRALDLDVHARRTPGPGHAQGTLGALPRQDLGARREATRAGRVLGQVGLVAVRQGRLAGLLPGVPPELALVLLLRRLAVLDLDLDEAPGLLVGPSQRQLLAHDALHPVHLEDALGPALHVLEARGEFRESGVEAVLVAGVVAGGLFGDVLGGGVVDGGRVAVAGQESDVSCGGRLLEQLFSLRAGGDGADGVVGGVRYGVSLAVGPRVPDATATAAPLPPLALGEAQSTSVHQLDAHELLQSLQILIVEFHVVVARALEIVVQLLSVFFAILCSGVKCRVNKRKLFPRCNRYYGKILAEIVGIGIQVRYSTSKSRSS